MRRCRRHREPLRRIGQIDRLLQIEFGVVTEARCLVGGGISAAQDRKLAPMQRCRALARTINDSDLESGRVIIEDDQDEGRARFGAGTDVVREMAPDDVARRRLGPPLRHSDDFISTKLDRTERLVPCGTRFLICRICAADRGPSSRSYWGRTFAASSCRARWMACV